MTLDPNEQRQIWIETACLWEAGAPKPGNVHPGAAFDDLIYDDFVAAASASAPLLSRSPELGVGRAILEAVIATRRQCGTNVNLGICLLLAPLAAVPAEQSLVDGIQRVLDGLTADDAREVYEAIRIANPGGLGDVPEQDVSGPPTCGLVEAMRLAENRDRIAWNYTHAFEDVLVTGPLRLAQWIERGAYGRNTLVVALYLELLSATPDTLVARKCGAGVAQEVADRARGVLDVGWPAAPEGVKQFRAFDTWLRSDGHRLNPGTTADIIAATLYAVLRDHSQVAARLLSADEPPAFG
jgi:triphosphoribosyl-dephospho-CoA synthase